MHMHYDMPSKKIIDHYPKPALDVLMNLLDSHDTERIITKIGFGDTEAVPLHERPTLRINWRRT